MKILVVGGGSGGHITPAIAVVRELLNLKNRTKIEYWTDRKYYKNVMKTLLAAEDLQKRSKNPNKEYAAEIKVKKICAGKFHRYAGWSLKDYFVYWRITLKDLIWGNICGLVGFSAGIVQSFCRLLSKKDRPDVIFLKGGFVGLPVGTVAKILKIPYVIHESDTVPGLANRLLMKRAAVVAMGMPYEVNDDNREKRKNWEWVGIPVAEEFKAVSEKKQRELKKIFGFDENKPLLVITGGSQGSKNINETIQKILPELLKITSVGLVAGRKYYEEVIDLKRYEEWDGAKLRSNFRMWEFNSTMNELMGAADVVISRAGATTIAELASLKKAVILVPYERLPGGHQVKNAERLEKKGAVMMVKDADMLDDAEKITQAVRKLVKNVEQRMNLAEVLHDEAKSSAAKRLAEIIIEVAKREK